MYSATSVLHDLEWRSFTDKTNWKTKEANFGDLDRLLAKKAKRQAPVE
jgi:hypothetical protein